jgi:hypothetical protein
VAREPGELLGCHHRRSPDRQHDDTRPEHSDPGVVLALNFFCMNSGTVLVRYVGTPFLLHRGRALNVDAQVDPNLPALD